MYWISSTASSPSVSQATRSRAPDTPVQALPVRPRDLLVGATDEGQDTGIEGERAIHIADGDADRIHRLDQLRPCHGGNRRGCSRRWRRREAAGADHGVGSCVPAVWPARAIAEPQAPGIDGERRIDPARARQDAAIGDVEAGHAVHGPCRSTTLLLEVEAGDHAAQGMRRPPMPR